MNQEQTPRRTFLARLLGAAAAAGLPISGSRTVAAQEAGPDDWLKEVKGTHRCLFDFPQHKNMFPQLHILNYLNTYSQGYKAAPGTVGAVGTFYSLGTTSSIALGFNDAMWTKYGNHASPWRPARRRAARPSPPTQIGSRSCSGRGRKLTSRKR